MLTTLHSGFFPGDSTINQVVDIYNTFVILLSKEKKSKQWFATLVKPLMEFRIALFSTNLNLLGYLVIFCRGFRTI